MNGGMYFFVTKVGVFTLCINDKQHDKLFVHVEKRTIIKLQRLLYPETPITPLPYLRNKGFI